MRKRLTVTLDEEVYDGLHRVVEQAQISEFVESLLRPYVIDTDLEDSYRRMAQDEEREAEANEWMEANLGHPRDETRRGVVGQL